MKHVVLFFLAALNVMSAPAPLLGVLKHQDDLELSLIYEEPVDAASLQDLASYELSSGTLISSRLAATNAGVVLAASGVPAGMASMAINGLKDPSGEAVPPHMVTFSSISTFWAAIGANELSLPQNVTAISTNGYDVFDGGIQLKDEYDEATFVGRAVNGDFDVKVRVDYLEPAGPNAKAGIMIREHLDEGRARPIDPEDPAQAFGRYLLLSIAAPTTVLGTPGHQEHQVWQRQLSPSFFADLIPVNNNSAPAFPNAWLRIQRQGQTFTLFRGENGTAWTTLISTNFPTAFPADAFVGVSFSAHNDDLAPGSELRKAYVAKFRNVQLPGETTPVISDRINIRLVGDHAELSWEGPWTLETATAVDGPWGTAANQANPQDISFSGTTRFFRLKR